LTIAGFAKVLGALQKMLTIDPAILVSDLFKARHFQSLTVLNGLHIGRGFEQAVVGAGVKPGEATAEALYMQIAALEIGIVYIGNLQLSAWRS
jgi:hypothetical protein